MHPARSFYSAPPNTPSWILAALLLRETREGEKREGKKEREWEKDGPNL